MTVNVEVWLLLIGAITPFVTAIVAKIDTPDWWKGLVSVTVAAAVAVFANVDASSVDFEVVLGDFIQVWGAHLLTWLGLSRDAARKLHEATRNVGIGPAKK